MAALIGKVIDGYNTFTYTWADERTKDWFLVGTPFIPMMIIYLYLKFIKDWGPKFMENRQPYDLKNTLLVYNIVQVIYSIYLFYEAASVWKGYSWICEPIDFSNTPTAMRVARATWLYYMAKYTELLDTVFFVLRKKQNQVSFLHLYHHSMMIFCGYIGSKFLPGGHGTFLGLINTFVHIIMYSYYLLTALGPNVQKYLWWKKHITRMQMFQFCLVFLHSLLILRKDCTYPKFVVALLTPNAMFFYFLFNDFYQSAYKKRNAAKAAKLAEENRKTASQQGEEKKAE
ncbi:elongation of very long chain fatty acids protein AAEL008004-like [Neocloeon triangulifer]|uniref:elongation of very long chain fatty acids protein AAEL008004-like n=1 Tax=Neocloeon triangulifer TaxID=2078957 RepID=UPI00286FA7C7|nr:elongation of very long chain fatty acids protein AAEL008004-like [Neocloeon triangulifer]XP_059472454.1 elongation of very long chain fatty acids protein AAEL008004-like [Neocloeon triangulifer]